MFWFAIIAVVVLAAAGIGFSEVMGHDIKNQDE
jgi:hypothetical protein